MAAIDDITAVSQSIYLAKNGRYNDVEGTELAAFLAETIDWINQFTQELELEADWNYLRINDNVIDTVGDTTTKVFELPDDVRTVVVSPYRDVSIVVDNIVISTFAMVNPNQIYNPTENSTEDRATVVNRELILSREPTEQEIGGEIRADTITMMPTLTIDDSEVINLIDPQALIILGVAKNATLPDIVQGGISPSMTQKYNDLLKKAVMINNQTSESLDMPSEDFGYIRGIW